MTAISNSLYTFLASKSAIRAIVALSSASPQQAAIYPQMLPEHYTGLPAITFAMDDNEDQPLLSGNSSLRIGLVSVDCWSSSYITSHALADAVKTELVGFSGTFGAHTADLIQKQREIDLYEDDTRLHRVSLQFSIAYY